MTEFALTRQAAAGIYSATVSLIVSADRLQACRSVIPSAFSVFVLQSSGLITAENEKTSPDQNRVPFIGLPRGLLGLVVSNNQATALEAFLAYAREQKPVQMPALMKVPPIGFLARKKTAMFLNRLLSEQLTDSQEKLADLQHQLVTMRSDNEQLWFGFEKARRMIVGMGSNSRHICYDLPAGTENIGPAENEKSFTYRQTLPVDVSNLSGVSLFVAAQAADDSVGKVTLSILRRSDQSVIAASSTGYDKFAVGWHHFVLPQAAGRTFGDGILQLAWSGAGGPRFALSSVTADRFGDEQSNTLAMRVEKGLVEPLSHNAGGPNERRYIRNRLLPSTMRELGHFYGGQTKELAHTAELGAEVLRLDENSRWLETHMLANDLSALHIPLGVGAGTEKISAQVTLAHITAMPGVAVIMSASPAAIVEGAVDNFLTLYEQENMPSRGSANGLKWIAKPIKAGCVEFVELLLDEPTKDAEDLIIGVLPFEKGRNDRGWCRWLNVDVCETLGSVEDIQNISNEEKLAAQSRLSQVRVHRFPEIADQLSYYRGKQAHTELREKVGFWPVEFSDDNGAMQLNPLTEETSAAILKPGLPENTNRVACEVGTAHPKADSFIFIVGTYSDTDEVETVVNAAAEAAQAGTQQGRGWIARQIPSLQKRRIELELSEPSKPGTGIFFATIPAVKGKTAFGWCRWYMLTMEMAGVEGAVQVMNMPGSEEA